LFTILKRSLVGLLAGYALYVVLVIVVIVEDLKYGFSIARGENFYVWVYPLMSPFLLDRQEWQQVPLEVNIITLCGGLLLFAGVVWANWTKVPR
jgi:hypothetical protein